MMHSLRPVIVLPDRPEHPLLTAGSTAVPPLLSLEPLISAADANQHQVPVKCPLEWVEGQMANLKCYMPLKPRHMLPVGSIALLLLTEMRGLYPGFREHIGAVFDRAIQRQASRAIPCGTLENSWSHAGGQCWQTVRLSARSEAQQNAPRDCELCACTPSQGQPDRFEDALKHFGIENVI